jgi:AcrR family transcriptional regulator
MNHTIRQHEIVEAARKIISTHGLKGLTIGAIARDLSLTDGALYRHVKSKREILDLLITEIETTLLESIDKASRLSSEPMEKLETIFASHLSYAERRRGITFLIISETLSLEDRGLQRKMLVIVNKYLERIGTILADGIAQGSFRADIDRNSAAIAFLGMVQSMSTVWALSGYKYSLKKGCRECFNIYKNGILSHRICEGPASIQR